MYDAGIINHVQANRSVRGYHGLFYLDQLLFDIDRKDQTLAQTMDRTKAFVETLKDDWIAEEYVRVWFSGRGFHVVVPDLFGFTPSSTLPEVVKATCVTHFPIADPIWYDTSLIRVGLTINKKSDLYKVQLSLEELFNLDPEEVEEIAKSPRRLVNEPRERYVPVHGSKIIMERSYEPADEDPRTRQYDTSAIVTCVQHMLNEGPQEGHRHENSLRIASAARRSGIPKAGTLAVVKDWAPGWNDREARDAVDWVFQASKPYSCHDVVMARYCDPKCIFFKRKNYVLDTKSADDMEVSFKNMVQGDFLSKGFDLGEVFTLAAPFHLLPGELVTLIGPTKRGKTAFVHYLCVALRRLRILYINTEIAQWLHFRRLIQCAHRMTKEEVFRHYRLQDNGLSRSISHITSLTQSPSLAGIKRLIAEHDPNLVVIDTSEGITVEDTHGEAFKQQTGLALGLRDMARDMNVIILLVHHLHKGAGGDRLGSLSLDSAKGASVIVQQSDKVLALEGELTLPVRYIRSLAARDEGQLELTFNYDHERMQWTQM
jgi:hypothetical protein